MSGLLTKHRRNSAWKIRPYDSVSFFVHVRIVQLIVLVLQRRVVSRWSTLKCSSPSLESEPECVDVAILRCDVHLTIACPDIPWRNV